MARHFDDTVFLSVRDAMDSKFGQLVDTYLKNAKQYIQAIDNAW